MDKTMSRLLLAGSLLALAACGDRAPQPAAVAPGSVTEWVLPAAPGSSAPDLALAPDGRLLLSWLNQQPGRRPALQFVALNREGAWQSQPRTVAVGNALRIDPADTPRVLATPDGALWMQWLQDAGEGAHAISLARSRDGGMQWSEPVQVPQAQAAARSGYVTLWPAGQDRLGIAWLERDATADAPAGASRLRSARMDMNLVASADAVIDPRACSCCQLAAGSTAAGALLAYRGQDEAGIGDISGVRMADGAWTAPLPVHADGWTMPACPVDGPALAVHAGQALVAWRSGDGDAAKVQLARSGDAGASYATPVQVDGGAAVRGPVAVALDERQAWVAWLREDAEGRSLQLARYTPDLARQLQQVQVARLQAATGGATTLRMAARDGSAWLLWSDVVDGAPDLVGATVSGER